MISYGFTKELDESFESVCERIPKVLEAHGFGVITRIDMAAKLREKLGVDVEKYMIFGACNPPNAYKAISAEPDIGLMLPCNVTVYAKAGKTVVGAIKPSVAMGMIDNEKLQPVAMQVEKDLKAVIDAM